MKTHSKLKNPPRPLFSCGIFGHCTQTVLSPTTPQPPSLPPPPRPLPSDPPPPPSDPPQPSSSSSSSSSTSQSFTQWRFPLPKPPFLHNPPPESATLSDPPPESTSQSEPPPPISSTTLVELFHVAELQLSTSSESARLSALQMLEQMLVPNPLPDEGSRSVACPAAVMAGVVGYLKDPAAARAATKVMLALCLAETNRRVAVEAGAVAEVVEAVAGMEATAAERALAVLELLCTVPEGAAGLRAHALSVPMLVEMVGKMAGRGKECAISGLAAIFSGGDGQLGPPPSAVAQAVVLALQGECSARGRRKGTQLLRSLQENVRLDLTDEGN